MDHQPQFVDRPKQRRVAGRSESIRRSGADAGPGPDDASPGGPARPLPVALASGIRKLSGVAVDDVVVHHDAPQPRALGARAFTRGTSIYVAPGEDALLAHEAWHVVQQTRGVKPHYSVAQVGINDSSALEDEAWAMGRRAALMGADVGADHGPERPTPVSIAAGDVVQRVIVGLEHIKAVEDVPGDWIDKYLEDIDHPTTHIYEDDIVTYLDHVVPNWHRFAAFENVENHFNITLTRGAEGGDEKSVKADKGTVKIATRADGSCAIHAIHAIENHGTIVDSRDGYFAPDEYVRQVRAAVKNNLVAKRKEIALRIVREVGFCTYTFMTGFGPSLQGALEQAQNQSLKERKQGVGLPNWNRDPRPKAESKPEPKDEKGKGRLATGIGRDGDPGSDEDARPEKALAPNPRTPKSTSRPEKKATTPPPKSVKKDSKLKGGWKKEAGASAVEWAAADEEADAKWLKEKNKPKQERDMRARELPEFPEFAAPTEFDPTPTDQERKTLRVIDALDLVKRPGPELADFLSTLTRPELQDLARTIARRVPVEPEIWFSLKGAHANSACMIMLHYLSPGDLGTLHDQITSGKIHVKLSKIWEQFLVKAAADNDAWQAELVELRAFLDAHKYTFPRYVSPSILFDADVLSIYPIEKDMVMQPHDPLRDADRFSGHRPILDLERVGGRLYARCYLGLWAKATNGQKDITADKTGKITLKDTHLMNLGNPFKALLWCEDYLSSTEHYQGGDVKPSPVVRSFLVPLRDVEAMMSGEWGARWLDRDRGAGQFGSKVRSDNGIYADHLHPLAKSLVSFFLDIKEVKQKETGQKKLPMSLLQHQLTGTGGDPRDMTTTGTAAQHGRKGHSADFAPDFAQALEIYYKSVEIAGFPDATQEAVSVKESGMKKLRMEVETVDLNRFPYVLAEARKSEGVSIRSVQWQ